MILHVLMYVSLTFLLLSSQPFLPHIASDNLNKHSRSCLLLSKQRPVCTSVSFLSSVVYISEEDSSSRCSLQSESMKSFGIKPDLSEL